MAWSIDTRVPEAYCILHSKRLLLNFCWISTSEICWRKGYIVDYPVTCFMPMKEMNSSSSASTGWGFPNAIQRSMFSYILQCTKKAFILPLICSQQCAMICFTSSKSSQTPRWAQTREQQLSACLSLLPSAMIAAKAREVWHEDKRAFPQSESFYLWERSCYYVLFSFPKQRRKFIPNGTY